jgi:cold shock CspA family protein
VGGKQQQQQQEGAAGQEGRARGTIQRLYPDRGFGFIQCTEGAPDDVGQAFFFHTSGLEDGLTMYDLLPGSLVEFESTLVPKGKRAEHVQRAR